MKPVDYASYTPEELEHAFSTSLTEGLSFVDIQKLQQRFGSNALKEQEISGISILIKQFKSPFAYLLIGAAFLSFLLHDAVNATTIAVILFFNGLLSFYQEYKAQQALKLLQSRLTMKASVLRDGAIVTVEAKELVPGDVILLKTGDSIPADTVLVEGSLMVDESVLTGESAPVRKSNSSSLETPSEDPYPGSICFLSTTVTEGSARGIVVATGSSTMFGEIGRLTVQTMGESGFQERISHLSNFIVSVMLISVVCLIAFHVLIKGTSTNVVQLLLFALALALGLTPEALPAVITFALSRGALHLARNHVLVKRLSAIEDLGAITVLCTDKTGTLTENKLSVSSFYEQKEGDALRYMLLASKKEHSENPFDRALVKAASDQLLNELSSYTLIKEFPFDPATRSNSLLLAHGNELLYITRGAFETIKELCSSMYNQEELTRWIETSSSQGNRILAVAFKKALTKHDLEQQPFVLGGLAAFYDPLKPTSKGALSKAHALGITVKMITGDSVEVAVAVARQIELPSKALTGFEFAKLSLEEKEKAVHDYTIFARIVPQQKYEIINLLKTTGVVGFVGEGINDAPALKAAHVGLVVKGASDNAQEAADIILLNKSLFAIIQGISSGRTIFSNTVKYIIAFLSSTFGNCYSIAVASLFIDFLPLLPLQILLMNLLSDLPMIAIATDTVDKDERRLPPRYDLGNMAFLATVLGLTSSLFDFITFTLFYKKGPSVLQTNWFIESLLTELVLIYSIRTKGPFFKAERPSFLLIALTLIAAAVTLLLPSTGWGQSIFYFKKPERADLLLIGALVALYFIATEIVKLLYYRYRALNASTLQRHKKRHRHAYYKRNGWRDER